MFNKDSVKLMFLEDDKITSRYYDINEATQQLITKAIDI